MELSANEYLDRIEDAIEQAIIECIDDQPNPIVVLALLAKAHGHMVSYRTPAVLNDSVRAFVGQVTQEGYSEASWSATTEPKPKRRDSVFGDLHADDIPKQFTDDPKPGKLPKLKPQGHAKVKYKPGIQKLLKGAETFECPTCHAAPGTNCFKFTGPGKNAELLDERNDGSFYHANRVALAKAANDRIRKANILQ